MAALQTMKKLLDVQEWRKFLAFASRSFKLPFPAQVPAIRKDHPAPAPNGDACPHGTDCHAEEIGLERGGVPLQRVERPDAAALMKSSDWEAVYGRPVKKGCHGVPVPSHKEK